MTSKRMKMIGVVSAVTVLMLVAAWMLWFFYPLTERELRGSDTRVVVSTRYMLMADEQTLFSFGDMRGDTLLTGITPKEMEYAKTVYQSLGEGDMAEVLSLVFEQPISLTGYRENDLYIPLGWCEGVMFSSVAVQVSIDGLQNAEEKIQEAAFLRAYQILRGEIRDSDRDRLTQAIRGWRNSTKQMRHVCFSLIDVPATAEEKYSQEGLLQDYLEDLLHTENGELRNSLIYDHLTEVYRQINYCHAILANIDPTDVIIHFCELIHNNEELLRKDDEGFFGGFKNNVCNVVGEFNEFLSYVDLSRVPTDVIKRLTGAAYILERLGYPYIAIMMQIERYDKALKASELKVKMLNLVTASSDIRQAMDVAHAIYVLHERNGSYQKIVYQIISLCEYSTDNNVRNWLYALYYLARQDALKTTGKTYLYRMLDTIYAHNNYSEGDADRLNDVRHGAAPYYDEEEYLVANRLLQGTCKESGNHHRQGHEGCT